MSKESRQEITKMSLVETESLSCEDKIKILRSPLPSVNIIKSIKSIGGISFGANSSKKIEE